MVNITAPRRSAHGSSTHQGFETVPASPDSSEQTPNNTGNAKNLNLRANEKDGHHHFGIWRHGNAFCPERSDMFSTNLLLG